jgi:uncharacterized membrane protein
MNRDEPLATFKEQQPHTIILTSNPASSSFTTPSSVQNIGNHNAPPLFQIWRGLVAFATVWAQRMDLVSNWSIILVFSFSASVLYTDRCSHVCFVALPFLMLLLSCIEAQRYIVFWAKNRQAEWVQQGYFVQILSTLPVMMNAQQMNNHPAREPTAMAHPIVTEKGVAYEIQQQWNHRLADEFSKEIQLAIPTHLSFTLAWIIRYQRFYGYLFGIALVLWYLKLFIVGIYPIAAMIVWPCLFASFSLYIVYKSPTFLKPSDV